MLFRSFVPTPDSEEWSSQDLRYKKDNRFFIDMVEYMDKIVGKIVNELKVNGIDENTLIMFIGDNGTNVKLVTKTVDGEIQGGKGNTITHGVHVPMVASWPSMIKMPLSYNGLIDLTDFYATFSDILDVPNDSDGKSMINIFKGKNVSKRDMVSIYYDPRWSKNVSQHRNVFSQDYRYKLYKDGEFYDMEKDVLENNPLKDEMLTNEEKKIKQKLAKKLATFPALK